jgi:hypothetical protein
VGILFIFIDWDQYCTEMKIGMQKDLQIVESNIMMDDHKKEDHIQTRSQLKPGSTKALAQPTSVERILGDLREELTEPWKVSNTSLHARTFYFKLINRMKRENNLICDRRRYYDGKIGRERTNTRKPIGTFLIHCKEKALFSANYNN